MRKLRNEAKQKLFLENKSGPKEALQFQIKMVLDGFQVYGWFTRIFKDCNITINNKICKAA